MGTKREGDLCYKAAMQDEPMFVLLARDPQAPELVRKWAKDRESKLTNPIMYYGINEGSGTWEQPDADAVAAEKAKIAEARYCAARMEVWRYENDGAWRNPDKKEQVK